MSVLVKENIFSHIYNVMSVLVKVAGHVTGKVYTKVLFTFCYKSEFCLELSYFLLSYSWSGRLVKSGVCSMVLFCNITCPCSSLVNSLLFVWCCNRSGTVKCQVLCQRLQSS